MHSKFRDLRRPCIAISRFRFKITFSNEHTTPFYPRVFFLCAERICLPIGTNRRGKNRQMERSMRDKWSNLICALLIRAHLHSSTHLHAAVAKVLTINFNCICATEFKLYYQKYYFDFYWSQSGGRKILSRDFTSRLPACIIFLRWSNSVPNRKCVRYIIGHN